MSDIEQFIDYLGNGDYANAAPLFQEIMATKLQDSLDAEQVRIASGIFDDEDVDDEDLDDLDDEEDEEDDEGDEDEDWDEEE